MLIQINENWRIKSTAESWMVEKLKGKIEGEKTPQWGSKGYCGTLADAMQLLFQQHVRAIEGSNCERIAEQIEKIRHEIQQAWRQFDEV